MYIKKFYNIGKDLFPLFRSITGKGTLKTLRVIKKTFPSLKIRKIKSGTKVFDWTVPPEWVINKAYILDKFGKKIIDIKNNNLHLVSYSKPIKKYFYKKKLMSKLFSIKKMPNAIPYVTSYYNRDWGFCIQHNQKKKLTKNYKTKDKFFVNIESSFLNSGYLNYADLVLPGESKKEIMISTYICHPSMANNELSGPIVSMALIEHFRKKKNNYTLRFVFLPETIGSIAYLKKNYHHLKKNVIAGYNLSCIGDERMHSCIFSKYKNTQADKALIQAYKSLKIKFKEFSFLERGSDERQYNSPGIELPICSVFRSKFGEYKEYHTSLDNFDLVTPKGLHGGFKIIKKSIEILQKKIIPINIILCEPQLSKKKLYPKITTKKNIKMSKLYLSFLQYADGKNDLSQISNFLKISTKKTLFLYKKLRLNKLVY